MKAACYERVGAARDVLQFIDLPDPDPASGEVRVRMLWSGVNPSDVKSRAGLRSSVMPFARVIPHSDGMGVIDAVGHGVSPLRIGQRVWLWNAAWGRPFGTSAEFVCLPQQQAVELPDAAPDEAGACMGIPGLTALHAVLMKGGVAGKTVLVAGGAGAVGHYAVQFARLLGAAQVISTVSSVEKGALALQAGADTVINYRQEPVAERVREITHGQGVDRLIEVDLGVNGALDLELLKTGGQCVVYGSSVSPISLPFYPLIVKNLSLMCFIVYNLEAEERRLAQTVLNNLLARGQLTHNISQRLPLQQIAQAHEMVEQGLAMGNVVLKIA